jgi:hypothetical protein
MKEIGRGILLEQGGGWIKLHRVSPEDMPRIKAALESELRHQSRTQPGPVSRGDAMLVWKRYRELSADKPAIDAIHEAMNSVLQVGTKQDEAVNATGRKIICAILRDPAPNPELLRRAQLDAADEIERLAAMFVHVACNQQEKP